MRTGGIARFFGQRERDLQESEVVHYASIEEEGSHRSLTRTRAMSPTRSQRQKKKPLRPLSPRIVRGYERYLKIALSLPLSEESTSYRTPSVKIAGKILSRWRTEAEGGLAIRCDFLDRQILLQANPDAFFLTEHYQDYPMILVHLDRIRADALADLVERAWRLVAPKKLIEQRDQTSGDSGRRAKRRRR
jgi:hypothetical protein